jgi:hypothetical protein
VNECLDNCVLHAGVITGDHEALVSGTIQRSKAHRSVGHGLSCNFTVRNKQPVTTIICAPHATGQNNNFCVHETYTHKTA